MANADLDKKGAQPPATGHQRTWDEPTFRIGLAVGLFLVLIALGLLAFFLVNYNIAVLVLCCGLGIVLGAFGSLAVINYKGLMIAGVAAIAIVLLFVVQKMDASFVRIRLDGDLKEAAEILLDGESPYPAARQKNIVDFFIVAENLGIERFRLTLAFPGTQGEGGREVIFPCIPVKAIQPYLGRGQILTWQFDRAKETLSGLKGVKDGTMRAGRCDDGTQEARTRPLTLVTSAFAQAGGIDALLEDLQSEIAAVRRDARDSLSQMGEPAIRPMMDYWSANADSYRVRLGVSVALTEFLRDNKDRRKQVSALLTDADFALIAGAIGDPDRTMRAYVTEFLFDLGDPRIVMIARQSFPTTSVQGKFNYVFVINGAVDDLTTDEMTELKELLSSWKPTVGSQTQAEIDKVLARL